MYSIASCNTDAVSVFPKGETSCWSAVILSPNFSFLTLKVGIGEGVSILVFLRDGSLLFLLSMEALFIPELEDVLRRLLLL